MPLDGDILEENGVETAGTGGGICVVWYCVKCPGCKSKNVIVTTSRYAPYRYQKCNDCGLNFTSLEANFDPEIPPLTSTIAQKIQENRQKEEENVRKNPDIWAKRARL